MKAREMVFASFVAFHGLAACHGASTSPASGEATPVAQESSGSLAPSSSPASSASPALSAAAAADLVDAAPPGATSSGVATTGPCGPTKITVDGKPMSIASARAYGFAAVDDAYVLVLSNKAISCKDLVKGSRAVARDEIYVDVGAGPNANAQQFLDSGNTNVHVASDVVRKPKGAGDPIEICVRDSGELVPAVGPQKTIAVSGLVKGTYCGTVK